MGGSRRIPLGGEDRAGAGSYAQLASQASRGGARMQYPPVRRGELDLLRAVVVLGLVFFHTAVIFGAGEFPVKAGAENRAATVFLAFGSTWGMPLLFVVSGMGIWYSLRSRSARAFARERLRRLLVPLAVGLGTLVPLQAYLGLRRSGDASSFAAFYARFWDVRPSLDFPFVLTATPGTGRFETGHLWFLVCLLAFSLVLLPGFAWLRQPAGARLVGRLARRLEQRQLRAAARLRLPRGRGRQDRRGAPAAVAARHGLGGAAVRGRRSGLCRGGRAWRPLRRHRPAQHHLPAPQKRRRLALGRRHPWAGAQPHRPSPRRTRPGGGRRPA